MIELETFPGLQALLDKAAAQAKAERRKARDAFIAALVPGSEVDRVAWAILNGDHGEAIAAEAHGLTAYQLLGLAGLIGYGLSPSSAQTCLRNLDPLDADNVREEIDLTRQRFAPIGFVSIVYPMKRPEGVEGPRSVQWKAAQSYGGALLTNWKAGHVEVSCIYPDGYARGEDYVKYGGRWHNVHLLTQNWAGVRWSEPAGFSPLKYAAECREKNLAKHLEVEGK
jgi:hypothetical protein